MKTTFLKRTAAASLSVVLAASVPFTVLADQTDPNVAYEQEQQLLSDGHLDYGEIEGRVKNYYGPMKSAYDMAKGMEEIPEGGERCFACYRLRLSEAASYAKAHGFDFFTTTLSISPLKNAEKLNQIGAELADTFDVRYLFSDFKKKEGYKKSTEISKEYHMYRQYYCGCVYSKRDRDREIVLRRQQEEQIL